MISPNDLIQAGFTQKTKTVLGETVPTDVYVMNGWVPQPTVDWERESRRFYPVITIENIQFPIKDHASLEKFVNKTLPIFCDPA